MAPEVFLDQPYNEKVDIYSYGIIIWQVATGQMPFKGARIADFGQRVVHSRERPPLNCDGRSKGDVRVPPQLASIMEKSWSYNPWERYSATELLHVMSDLQDSQTNSDKKPFSLQRKASKLLATLMRPSTATGF